MFPPPWRSRRTGPQLGGIAGVIVAIIAIVVAVIVLSQASAQRVSPRGPCFGGPITGSTGQPMGHGNYRFPCADGGSTVVHLGN